MAVQIGCGLYEHTVRGRTYLYFWHYELRGSRRIQVKEYLGPARSPEAREEAARRCDAYYRRAAAEIDRAREAALLSLRRRRG